MCVVHEIENKQVPEEPCICQGVEFVWLEYSQHQSDLTPQRKQPAQRFHLSCPVMKMKMRAFSSLNNLVCLNHYHQNLNL